MRFLKRTVSSIEKDTALFNYVNKNFELSSFWIESEKKRTFKRCPQVYTFSLYEKFPHIYLGERMVSLSIG